MYFINYFIAGYLHAQPPHLHVLDTWYVSEWFGNQLSRFEKLVQFPSSPVHRLRFFLTAAYSDKANLGIKFSF